MTKRRGISPVIATVIIVAVTIAVAIAVAFWMTGIIGLFTGFEQLQIASIWDDANGIHLIVENTGTATASVVDVYINGFPATTVLSGVVTITADGKTLAPDSPIVVNPGQRVKIDITFTGQPTQFTVRPGVSLEIKLHTAAGKDYPKLIVLQAYSPPSAS